MNKSELSKHLIEKYKMLPIATTIREERKGIESLLEKELETLLVPEDIVQKELNIVQTSSLPKEIKDFYSYVPKNLKNKYLLAIKEHGSPLSYLRIRSNELIINSKDDSVFSILMLTLNMLLKRYANEILPNDIYIDPLHSEEYLTFIAESEILAIRAFPIKYTTNEYAILCQLLVEKKDRGRKNVHTPVVQTPVHA